MFKKSFAVICGLFLLGYISSNVNADQSSAFEHLKAFQKIAEENGGNRAAGTVGYDKSGEYIAEKLKDAGYNVEYQEFQVKKYMQTESAEMRLVEPQQKNYSEDTHFLVLPYSGSGEVSAMVTAIDVALGLGNKSTSGCEADDFENFPEGSIALIQRGTCDFTDKVQNAVKAGASAVVIFNQGNTEHRKRLFSATLGEDFDIAIPVLATNYDFGVEIMNLKAVKLHVKTQTKISGFKSFNVIAETPTGNPDNVVMIGAHLDGVKAGPGINDNGSGSAAILDVALKMKDTAVKNKIRFAWWGAEEIGLIGSRKYVRSLSDEEKSKIALYLNFDMIASPNYTIRVYDGDGSAYGDEGPQGSGAIESLLKSFYKTHAKGSFAAEFDGRSDYEAFYDAGIPVGGVFTGAEGIKSEKEAEFFGGTAGVAYDVCYHRKCDNLKNINIEALELNTNAIAHLASTYGESTESLGKKESRAVSANRKRSDKIPISCHEHAYIR